MKDLLRKDSPEKIKWSESSPPSSSVSLPPSSSVSLPALSSVSLPPSSSLRPASSPSYLHSSKIMIVTIESSSSTPSPSSSCLRNSMTYGVAETRRHRPVNYACDYSFTVD
ncbi:hypothetical protein ElyMa_004160600 [Elysia marginata]|uniref:REJ domain-containing protein n=1 Tax=Elysia marginata TaxID=1093978 RepID=A0AAV4GHC8_9GAST|nr:hypothetical protein ElyMa_004160600 [Elysia marginata]